MLVILSYTLPRVYIIFFRCSVESLNVLKT
jgi:hypothetical protein